MSNWSPLLGVHYLIITFLQFVENLNILDVHGGDLVKRCNFILKESVLNYDGKCKHMVWNLFGVSPPDFST